MLPHWPLGCRGARPGVAHPVAQPGELAQQPVVSLVQGGDLALLQQDHHLLVPEVAGHLHLVPPKDVLLGHQPGHHPPDLLVRPLGQPRAWHRHRLVLIEMTMIRTDIKYGSVPHLGRGLSGWLWAGAGAQTQLPLRIVQLELQSLHGGPQASYLALVVRQRPEEGKCKNVDKNVTNLYLDSGGLGLGRVE